MSLNIRALITELLVTHRTLSANACILPSRVEMIPLKQRSLKDYTGRTLVFQQKIEKLLFKDKNGR